MFGRISYLYFDLCLVLIVVSYVFLVSLNYVVSSLSLFLIMFRIVRIIFKYHVFNFVSY